MSYGVDVTNIFELLPDEDGEKVVQKAKPEKKEEKKVSGQQAPKKNEAKAPQGTRAPPQTSPNSEKKDKIEPVKEERREKRERRDKAGNEKNERSERNDRNERKTPRPPRTEGSTPREGGGGNQGGQQESGAERRGKRVYDRHSGTGRGKEVKKGGAGKANWGVPVDEPDEKPVIPETVIGWGTEETVPTEGGADVQSVVNAEPKVEEKASPFEDEDKTITLDEFRKQKESKTPQVVLPSVRLAGEGEDPSAWKDFTVYQRAGPDSQPIKQAKKTAKKADSQKQLRVDEVFKVQEENRQPRRSPRGERKGGNNNKNFGGAKGKRQNNKPDAPSFDDKSFPALVA